MGATVFALNELVTFEATQCGVCGVLFAMTASHVQKRHDDGGEFHCPNGHILTFTNGENERLRHQLKRAQREHRKLKTMLKHKHERSSKRANCRSR